ncbi:MAG: 2-dehydro-3-deoxygalactonokinase [Rhodospirillaceae bacterium]|nr:2-dehydro-3-deoxygalactonokinase [Rhodospirillaceae bacterium]
MGSGCFKPAIGTRMPPEPVRLEAALLGLDWGTTSLRGYLMAADGRVLAERGAEAGILNVENAAFAVALNELAGDWLAAHPDMPIIASGMIGSRQGWAEVAYVDLPAAARDLNLYAHDDFARTVYFIPGLAYRNADGVPDVMRGEETQIFGAGTDGLYLLPGSHSKWALVEDGHITWFATFMTGELFAALKDHTILGRMMSDGADNDDAAFVRGVKHGFASNGALQTLFSARTLALFGELPESGVADYLSGLLIGTEITEAGLAMQDISDKTTIISNPDLGRRYLRALSCCGLSGVQAPDGAAARGQWRIAMAAGLLA